MTENVQWKIQEDDEHSQEEPSSRHLLVALENLLKQSEPTPTFTLKNKYQSKSFDDLLFYRRERIPSTSTNTTDQQISTTTRTEFDLSSIDYDDDEDHSQIQRSRSTPTSPTKIYEKELGAFIDYDQQVQDNFVYNIDLSDSKETPHSQSSKLAIFFEDDYSGEEITYEPSVSLIHSSLINNCLTITEENEEELEELRRGGDDNEEQQQQQKEDLVLEIDQNSIDRIDNDLKDMHNHFDKRDNYIERLSTIYESPSPQPEIDQSNYDKLTVYDIANIDQTHFTDTSFPICPKFTSTLNTSSRPSALTTHPDDNSCLSTVFNPQTLFPEQQHQAPTRSSSILFPIDNKNRSISSQKPAQHVRTMKVIQSTSTSLSDFISSTPMSTLEDISNYEEISNVVHQSLINCSTDEILDNSERKSSFSRGVLTNGLLRSHCASNPTSRRVHRLLYPINGKSEEKVLSDSSSSSENLSSSDEKLLSRSEFLLQHEQNICPQRKASSLKNIFIPSSSPLSKILYPIDFGSNDHSDIFWHSKRSHQVPTSDSGIMIDTRPTSKSSIEEDDQLELYHKTFSELRLIKEHIVDIENHLNEAMRELEIEQALIEGEHELLFKQILETSESDQQKIRQLYRDLQVLVERIMTEKNSLRNEIEYTQEILRKHELDLYQLEQHYRSSDEKVLRKKEILAAIRKRYEDLEFQLMEFETRCESELEQAEEHFQIEQKIVTENAEIRQNTLHELDHQQYLILYQATMEKERLEREKQKLKLIFKQKKIEANELEEQIHEKNSCSVTLAISEAWRNINQTNDQSTSINLFNSSPQIRNNDDQRLNEMIAKVKFREKKAAQERPLTRYLPIRSADFDLRAHIEGAGHSLNSTHLSLTSTSCRGYLQKMGGMKFKTWNRRWFVFDRRSHSLFYYQDKSETKLRGCIAFQSILEVYLDHLQSISLRSPEPRDATFIVKTIGRSYYLVAPTVELMRIWVDVIITGAEGNTFARN